MKKDTEPLFFLVPYVSPNKHTHRVDDTLILIYPSPSETNG